MSRSPLRPHRLRAVVELSVAGLSVDDARRRCADIFARQGFHTVSVEEAPSAASAEPAVAVPEETDAPHPPRP